MEFYLFSPLFFFLAIYFVIAKRVMIGDFAEIRWNDQPILFVVVIVLFCLCAFDGFCGILSIFNWAFFSEEDQKILDGFTSFLFSFVLFLMFVLVKKIVIKKKGFTWKETPLIRSSFVVVFFVISVYFLMRII